jgi:RHS repeat-associated protein
LNSVVAGPAHASWQADNFALLGSSALSGFSLGTWYTLALRANGNQLSVEVNGSTAIGPVTTTFKYDGDGNGVMQIAPNGDKTVYVNNTLEVFIPAASPTPTPPPTPPPPLTLNNKTYLPIVMAPIQGPPAPSSTPRPIPLGQTWKSYYAVNGQPVAMRVADPLSSTVYYLHADHLGSISAISDLSGSVIARQWYYPYGAVRASSGALPTDITFTGQRADATGLMYFRARYYSGLLGRFLSADSIVPGARNPQALNRYSYVLGNPLKYTDPSGHWTEEELEQFFGENWMQEYFSKGAVFEGRDQLLKMLQSKSTTGLLELSVIHDLMSTAQGLHAAGLSFGAFDAIGARLTASVGAVLFGGGTADAILNMASGEFSVFGALQGGVLLGDNVQVVGGLLLIRNLARNDDYRKTYGAVGLAGGDIVGINVEGFWSSPMSDRFDPTDKAHGMFVGAGLAIPEIGVYGEMGFSYEALRVDKSGTSLFPQSLGWQDVKDTFQAVVHDVLLHPIWPWSPYR